MKDRLLPVQEVAEYLAVPLSSVYDMTHRKAIPFLKIGSRLRFRQSDIDKWLEEHASNPSGKRGGNELDVFK